MEVWAWGTFRARLRIIAKESSAVETVFPPGVFITTTPCSVAAGTSTLSVPTPARPTTRSLGAASITGRVTFVSERSEEHTFELQSHLNLVCRLLLETKKIA